MKKPNNFKELIGYRLGSKDVTISAKDAILYAIGCGANYKDLDLVYEKQLKILPGIATTLGLWAVERCGDLGVYDRKKSLHVSQSIELKRSIEVDSLIHMNACVESVWDRGNATIVDVLVTSEYFNAKYSIFIPGIGGWGGDSPKKAAVENIEYDITGEFKTNENQAIIYRLTGDLHPVHIDFNVAKDYGFEKPILHGLCTLGIALRLISIAAGKHPAELKSATCRMTSPVLPGDNLTLFSVENEGLYAFELKVGDKTVLKDGLVKF